MSRLAMFEYDPEWPRMFNEEALRLASVWGDQCSAIHHIGSTSVPDLEAKPIIDIVIVVKDVLKVHDFDDAMTSLGYWCRGVGITPGRHYYSKDINGLRTHQAHAMQEGHFEIEQNRSGIVEYMDGKNSFVKHCIAKAAIW